MEKKNLIKELDKTVSVIVRKRDNRCATCGKRLPFKMRQAGHFVPRVVQVTRWDLNNVNVQCQKCNVYLDGNIVKYREFIARKYGDEQLSRLDNIKSEYDDGRMLGLTTEEMEDLLEKLKNEHML